MFGLSLMPTAGERLHLQGHQWQHPAVQDPGQPSMHPVPQATSQSTHAEHPTALQHPKKAASPLQRPSAPISPAPPPTSDRGKDITVVCIAIVVRFYCLFFFFIHIIVIIQNIQTGDAKRVVGHHALGLGVTPCDLQCEGGGSICSAWQGTVGNPEGLGGGRRGEKETGGVRIGIPALPPL